MPPQHARSGCTSRGCVATTRWISPGHVPVAEGCCHGGAALAMAPYGGRAAPALQRPASRCGRCLHRPRGRLRGLHPVPPGRGRPTGRCSVDHPGALTGRREQGRARPEARRTARRRLQQEGGRGPRRASQQGRPRRRTPAQNVLRRPTRLATGHSPTWSRSTHRHRLGHRAPRWGACRNSPASHRPRTTLPVVGVVAWFLSLERETVRLGWGPSERLRRCSGASRSTAAA